MVSKTDEKGYAHRPGLFKLPNKKHKTGQHRSKREVAQNDKGKLGVRALPIAKTKKLNKVERKNQMQQFLVQKHKELVEKNYIYGYGNNRAPYLTTILLFDSEITNEFVFNKLADADWNCVKGKKEWGNFFSLRSLQSNAVYKFLTPDQNTIMEVLDCIRISEILIIFWPVNEIISEQQQQLLTILMVQGIPVILNLVVGLPPNGKQRDQIRKRLNKSMSYWPSLSNSKVGKFDSLSDAKKVLRLISTIQRKPTLLQQRHPYLLVDTFLTEETNDKLSTLIVSGHLYGSPLDVNKMVHIQGFGDFKLLKVEIEVCGKYGRKNSTLLPKETSTLENDEENMKMDIDDVQSDDLEDEELAEDVFESSENNDNLIDSELSEEDEEMNEDTNKEDEINLEEVEKYRHERENAQWPDEVETPQNISAKKRFMKYRGLKSFRTSFWDPKENLPNDYARIYKFSNFKQTKKRVLTKLRNQLLETTNIYSSVSDELAYPGSYATLYIKNVPSVIQEELKFDQPFVIFGLLQHEEKMSVMNIVLEKHSICNVPIRNREKLIFQVGYRRFEADALFSQHNNGNKFKMERFMPAEGSFCASVFAPIIFPPSTTLVFRRDAKRRIKIVASGNVLDINPDRVVLKRIVLSGHPFKVNKRLAVVRYMFFNKDDVEWFKPVEVYTVKGRRGHIKESLGTHGLMKCLFDQPLSTQDSVLMNLYKRVFPKFSYSDRIPMVPALEA